jgi:hypothetical protein
LRYLQLPRLGYVTTPIADMDDDHFVTAHPVIDKIGIASGRKYANAGDVSLASEAGISGEQAARGRICRTIDVAALVLCRAMYW